MVHAFLSSVETHAKGHSGHFLTAISAIMENMANTSSRTLRLLSLLQNHRFWPGHDLAERLDVSPRTLRRDVDRLRELGYPVEAHRGVDGGYQLAAGAALPPLVIDDEEAVAVAAALQTAAAHGAGTDAASGAAPGTAIDVTEPSLRVLAKITQVMPAPLRRRVEALTEVTVPAMWGSAARPRVDPGILTTVAMACRDAERIRFSYTAADATRTERYAEPHRLVSLGGRWYLVGYDLTRQDWRTFRLDRIADPPRPTGERFRPRPLPAPDAATYVRESIGRAFAVYDVEVLIDAPAGTVRSRIGRWAQIEELPGGRGSAPGGRGNSGARCRVRMTADSLDWPLFALGIVGAGFEVVSPPELRDRVADWAARFTAATATIDG
jgi:predicted DNA-binding transcriptional regulator YafY